MKITFAFLNSLDWKYFGDDFPLETFKAEDNVFMYSLSSHVSVIGKFFKKFDAFIYMEIIDKKTNISYTVYADDFEKLYDLFNYLQKDVPLLRR